MSLIKFGILTVSDSCYKDKTLDKSGPALHHLVSYDTSDTGKILNGKVHCTHIVPDNENAIKDVLVTWSDNKNVDVILTTGGTGVSRRDVTPKATAAVVHKEVPGMSVAMLVSSLKITPMAMLSGAVCGIRGRTLIVNLPGSPKAATECLTTILTAIPHAVDLIRDNKAEIRHMHKTIQTNRSFPPCSSGKHNTAVCCLESVADRSRQSPYPMISVESALELVKISVEALPPELVNADNAYGRIIVDNLYSEYDLPPFRASIKDGYAVLASDGKGRRRVLGGVKAGTTLTDVTLAPGTCMRVNTGAPIPEGATAVVQVEDTVLTEGTSDKSEEMEIEIMTDVKYGQDIRPIGSDIRKSDLILRSKTKLEAAELGLLHACGFVYVTVAGLPKVGVLSTGDELQNPGGPLLPGHVYDSNKITLQSILRQHGAPVFDMGISPDDETSMVACIKRALEQVDVLVTSGSVSMGDRDMLKPILKTHFNATIHFGRVNMKPGKPTTFATCSIAGRKKYFMCLPGNPVSASVTMHLFVLPLLQQLSGDDSKPILLKAKITESYELDPRPEYARAILKWDSEDVLPKAYSTGNQISSRLLSCRNANAYLLLPGRTVEKTVLLEGDVIEAMLL